ncbi:MAG: cytochrome c3 family protein, partial [Alcanivoracaceae bacterium]
NLCESCHSPAGWTPVGRVDHAEVQGNCASCHNGNTAPGKPANHIQSGNACDDCHNTNTFTGARFDHSSVSGNCASCHNGTTATGKPGNHFVTTVACEECHTVNGWTPAIFRHSGAAYPGDHRGGLDCRDCHTNNNQVMNWQFPAYQPDCAACHASDYEPDEHRNAPVSQLRDCAGSCHQSNPEHSVNDKDWE